MRHHCIHEAPSLPWSISVTLLELRSFRPTQALYIDIESLQQDRLTISVDSTISTPTTFPFFPPNANETSYKAQMPYKNAHPYPVYQPDIISESSLSLHPSFSRPPSPLPPLLQSAIRLPSASRWLDVYHPAQSPQDCPWVGDPRIRVSREARTNDEAVIRVSG
jgi:hypothetical protein